MAVMLLIFPSCDCTLPRKLKNHIPEGEFQQNLAQSRTSIETHNWNNIFLLMGDFTGKIVFTACQLIC